MKRDNKQFFAYIKDTVEGSNQYVRHIANKPPARLTVPYERIRTDVARELRIANAELIEMGENAEETAGGGEGGRKVSPEVQHKHELVVQQVTFVDQLVAEGKMIKDACDLVGIPRPRYQSLKKGDIKWFNDWRQ